MSDIRPAREIRYAESAGEGFVNTRAFELLSRAGFVARATVKMLRKRQSRKGRNFFTGGCNVSGGSETVNE